MTIVLDNNIPVILNEKANGAQVYPATATLRDGRHIVIWGDGGQNDYQDRKAVKLTGQFLSPEGNKLDQPFSIANASTLPVTKPSVAGLPDGGFVVIWHDGALEKLSTVATLRAQIFGADGLTKGPQIEVATHAWGSNHSEVIALEGGGFAIAWRDEHVNFRIFDAEGNGTEARSFGDPPFKVPELSDSIIVDYALVEPTMVALPEGGFILGADVRLPGGREYYQYALQKIDANGDATAEPFFATPMPREGWHYWTGSYGSFVRLANGTFVLVSAERSQEPTTSVGQNGLPLEEWTKFYATFFNEDGVIEGSRIHLPALPERGWSHPTQLAITPLPEGGFAVVWMDVQGRYENALGTTRSVIQLFDDKGRPRGEPLEYTNTEGVAQSVTAPLLLADGSLLAVFDVLVMQSRGYGPEDDFNIVTQKFTYQRENLISGTDLADRIFGTDERDTIYGYAGNDIIFAGLGNDDVYGGAGNDSIVGGGGGVNNLFGDDGQDTIIGGPDGDLIGGGAGDDIIRGGVGNDTIYGGTGNDNIGGGAGADLIYASAGHNIIWGGLGADTIYGSLGSDTIYGGEDASDQIFGGAGDDLLIGGGSHDTIHGGAGDDHITSGDFSKSYGGDGDDYLVVSGVSAEAYGGEGNDRFELRGDRHEIFGGAGADYIESVLGGHRLYGGDGSDTIIASGGDHLIGGGAGNDYIYGGAGDDTIWGGLGADTIWGGGGDDLIYASAGSGNVLYGGSGSDTMVASFGRDVFHGDDGGYRDSKLAYEDVFVFNSAAHIGIGGMRDMIFGFVSGEDRIDLRSLATQFNSTSGLIGGGQKSFYHYSRDTLMSDLLIGDQDGDGVADWVLEINFSGSYDFAQSIAKPDKLREFELSDFLL